MVLDGGRDDVAGGLKVEGFGMGLVMLAHNLGELGAVGLVDLVPSGRQGVGDGCKQQVLRLGLEVDPGPQEFAIDEGGK